MSIRTFLAIELDKKSKEKIKNKITEFKKINPHIKYVNPENIHLTLKFFGNLEKEEINTIKNIITNTLKEFKEFKINIESMGAFPNTKHIKVIWIGVKENQTLENLQKTLDNEFSKIGFEKERNYKMHITIGRMKTPKGKKQVQEKIIENKNLKIGEVKIDSIYLKKSTLTPNGPIYENIEVFNLI